MPTGQPWARSGRSGADVGSRGHSSERLWRGRQSKASPTAPRNRRRLISASDLPNFCPLQTVSLATSNSESSRFKSSEKISPAWPKWHHLNTNNQTKTKRSTVCQLGAYMPLFKPAGITASCSAGQNAHTGNVATPCKEETQHILDGGALLHSWVPSLPLREEEWNPETKKTPYSLFPSL